MTCEVGFEVGDQYQIVRMDSLDSARWYFRLAAVHCRRAILVLWHGENGSCLGWGGNGRVQHEWEIDAQGLMQPLAGT